MKLYGYWRSSAAYRVRIALHLKMLEFENIAVHLVKNGGEQHQSQYSELNPSELVPTLVDDDLVLNQSLAIIDYIDSAYPKPALYPSALKERVKAQALALDIACEIHPVNNLRIQQYLVNEAGLSEQNKLAWCHHWMNNGFLALEKKLQQSAGRFCYGDSVSVADICLIPQVYNANRINLDMSAFPIINRIALHCNSLPAFQLALPENQPDAAC